MKKGIAKRRSALLCILSGLLFCVQAQARESQDPGQAPRATSAVGQDTERQEIIAGQPLEGGVEETGTKVLKGGINETGVQKGGIHKGSTQPLTGHIKMSPQQYEAAVKQYQSDLAQFYLHAHQYSLGLSDLKKQIGECHENEDQWQLKLSQDQLNMSQVQIPNIPAAIQNNQPPPPPPPNIPPPRICCVGCLITGRCGHLGTGGGGARNPQQAANAARIDAMRQQAAMTDMSKAQGALNYSKTENIFTSQKAVDETKVQEKQAQLSGQFSSLQQEYGMLKIEKGALVNAKH